MNEKYQPSNGTEGCYFLDKFCDNCIHEKWNHTQKDTDKKCDILSRTMIHDVKDAEYPPEWTYDANGEPTCTNFVKWDWDNDGDPDDRDNPKAPITDDPNQLVFPFILEEIEQNIKVEQLEHA